MKENLIKLTYKLAFVSTVAAAAAAPLFFLPLTSEFFEYNKFTLLLALTIISVLSWAVRMVLQKRFSFTKSPLDIPILIFIVIFLIASFSSIDQHISIFGTGSSKWPSLIAVLTIAAFYFSSVSNLKSKKEVAIVLFTIIGATVVAAIVSILSYFGVFFPFDFTKFRAFTTVGSPNRLALLEALVLPLCVSWVIFQRNRSVRALSFVASLILFLSLVLINFQPAYIGLGIGVLVIAAGTLQVKITKNALAAAGALAIIAAAIVAIRFIPPLSKTILEPAVTDPNNPADKTTLGIVETLSQKAGWDIAASTIGKRPLFGTGPGTYQFAYTQLKPRSINNTKNWVTRFENSSSEFTEMVATTGILGTLAFLLLVTTVIRFTWRLTFKDSSGIIYLPVAASVVSGIALTFFASLSITQIIALFIAIIAIATLAKTQDEKHVQEMTVEVATLRKSLNWLPTGNKFASLKASPAEKTVSKSQALPVIFLLFALIFATYSILTHLKSWRAEYLYRQALIAASKNEGNRTIALLQDAIRTNPGVDTYHRVLSQTALAAAINLNQKKDLTTEERNLLAQLATAAIEQAKVASGYQILPLRIPGISAANVVNWEALSTAYQAVIGSVQGADINALNTLSQASSLDPENPFLRDQLGLLQQRLKNLDSAQRSFEDAIVIKGDYGPAHYHLARLLIERNGDVARIASELTLAKRFLPKEDPALPEIDKNLETYNKKLEQLRQETSSQTQEPSASPSPTPSPTASPRSRTSATPSPAATPLPSLAPIPTPSL